MAGRLKLEVLEGTRLVRAFTLGDTALSIGRGPDSDVVLADRLVSTHHARLEPADGAVRLTDLGSAHGLVVRGKKQREVLLRPGDEVLIGPFTIRLLAEQPDARPADLAGIVDLAERAAITDLQAVLDALLGQAMSVAAATHGFVVLAGESGLSPVIARHGTGAAPAERFSRTLCQQAVTQRRAIVLENAADWTQVEHVPSLVGLPPHRVAVVPLESAGEVLGVVYLECRAFDRPAPPSGAVVAEVADLGGRALKAALSRRQIVEEAERWRWLATDLAESPDMLRTASSPSMQSVIHVIRRVAAEDVTALILGESGTGKEVTARTIHALSPRANGPLVAINCGAIPRDLMEAELFGHEKGAFTGAVARKAGRFELAHGGTLFLDEVGELPRDLQVKLLRVLESRTFERLGSEETRRWDGRVLAATNRDLEQAIASGEFREDLYWRLNVVSIRLPPLRERPEDIPLLVNEMLLSMNRRFRRKLLGVTPDALSLLQAYRWPGNVRELKNVMERAFILETTDQLTVSSLPVSPSGAAPAAGGRFGSPVREPVDDANDAEPAAPIVPLDRFVEEQERAYIRHVLARMGNNVTRAAEALGVGRTALHRKMKQLGLKRGAFLDDEPD